MPSTVDRYNNEDDWEIVPEDWWTTSYKAVSWSFTVDQDPADPKRRYRGSLFLGFDTTSGQGLPRVGGGGRKVSEEEDDLNMDLVGAKLASEVLLPYERDVGFNNIWFPQPQPFEVEVDGSCGLNLERDEEEVQAGREKWNDLVEELMNGPAYDNSLESDDTLESSVIGSFSSYGDLDRSTSSFDMTSSEGSVDSLHMPVTPQMSFFLNNTRVRDPSSSGSFGVEGQAVSPNKSLNASAALFVPTFCSHLHEEPPSFTETTTSPKILSSLTSFSKFTFPTLNPTSPRQSKKEEQNLLTEAEGEQPATSDLLPPFLQESTQRTRPRKSRTREMVDRLRSENSPEENTTTIPNTLRVIQRKFASHSPSPIGNESAMVTPRLSVSEDGGDRASRLSTPSSEEDDGWIDVKQPTTSITDKSQRTRELFLALTRRRTDSSSSIEMKDIVSSTSARSPSPSPLPVTPATGSFISNDGWIESHPISPPPPQYLPQQQQQQKKGKNNSHSKKKSSNNNNASRTSTSQPSSSHHPPPPGVYAVQSAYYPQVAQASLSPHIVSPQGAAFPYFYPTYTAVGLPAVYPTAYAHHMPAAYPMGIPVHGAHAAPIGMSYVAPGLVPMRTATTKSVVPPVPNVNTINAPSAYAARVKHSPVW
ncbi:hypothetical protein D9613_000963 [Agrocybe pediades]|uniref:Uncharacterized protein n=1 Tax=Agrocybe pediades TaxID=84607 RepID=A0A8H4VUG6_9AGAR|nr:hypothetical protein D9613_000963 [Agrocybe pediades]